MQMSHRSIQEYTNKLLLKASNIHMKQNEETISPIRKKSVISSIIPSIANDTDQWTDRIKKQLREKHRSCSNMEDFCLQKQHVDSTQFLIMAPNMKQTMVGIEKKLKNFKFAKENDHNSCASSIAKMKCFCLDNCCFDFYRCTDLELNSANPNLSVQHTTNNSEMPILKNMVKDAIAIMHETVEEMKNKQFMENSKSIDQLNQQIRKMKQTFGFNVPNFDNFTTPQSNLKKSDIFPQSATQKREFNQTSPSVNSQKIIQFQIDELSMKNEQIEKLNRKIKDLEQQIKTLNQQLGETNLSLQISQKSLQNKESELKDLIQKVDKLLDTTSQAVKDKDEYQTSYKNMKHDHDQLKLLFDDLQRSNQSMRQEYQVLKQSLNDSYQSELAQSKLKKDEDQQRLQHQVLEKSKQQLAEDGQSLARSLKDVANKIMQVPADQLPSSMQQLQRDLYLQESQMNVKLNNMHLAQLDLTKSVQQNKNSPAPRKMNHNQLIDQVSLYKNHSDFLQMIVIQCEVIEKFIN